MPIAFLFADTLYRILVATVSDLQLVILYIYFSTSISSQTLPPIPEPQYSPLVTPQPPPPVVQSEAQPIQSKRKG